MAILQQFLSSWFLGGGYLEQSHLPLLVLAAPPLIRNWLDLILIPCLGAFGELYKVRGIYASTCMKTISQSKTQVVPAPFFICHGAGKMEPQGLSAVMVLDSSFPNAFVKSSHTKENAENRGSSPPISARRASYSVVLTLDFISPYCLHSPRTCRRSKMGLFACNIVLKYLLTDKIKHLD